MRALLVVAVAAAVSMGSVASAQTPDQPPAAETPAAPLAQRQAPEAKEFYKRKEYAKKNTWEVGGSLALSWTDDLFSLEIGPTLGLFVADRWELSLITRVTYNNTKQPDGTRTNSTEGVLEIEPSYHFPLKKNLLYFFGGLGVGLGFVSSEPVFEGVPRVGLKIAVGRSGFLTPAALVPIVVGRISGPMNEDIGVKVGFGFQAGFTTDF